MITRSTATRFTAAGLAAALMFAVAAPSAEARGGRTAAAAAGGFAAGAVVGSAVASNPYYHRGYAYEPQPYGPAYAYEPGYSAYAAAPGYPYGDYQVSVDEADNPIYASELGGPCTFGDQLDNRC